MANIFELGCAWLAGGLSFYLPDTVGSGPGTLTTVDGRACIGFTASGQALHGTSNTPHTLGASEIRFFSFGIYITAGDLANLPDVVDTNAAYFMSLQSANPISLGIKAIDASTFNLILSGPVTAGTITLSVSTWYDIRVAMDNAANTINVWIDAASEFTDAARTVDSATPLCTLSALTGTGITNYFSSIVVSYGTDASADRPSRNPEGHYIGPNGDDASATYSNDPTAGNCSDGSGTYTNWDDWNSGEADDNTTVNACCGNVSGKEISNLTTAALTLSTVNGAMMSTWLAAREAKSCATWHILKDTIATTEAELACTNAAVSSYASRRTSWVDPPAGAWADYISSATFNHASASRLLGAGVRNVNTNSTADKESAMGVEIFLWTDDPPSTSNRRRRLAQVV